MAIVAMSITTAEDVPKANNLRVYTAVAGDTTLTFVANRSHVYEVGNVVAVAQVGTILEEGLEIKPVTIRGVESFGMGLGVIDLPVGTEVPPESLGESA